MGRGGPPHERGLQLGMRIIIIWITGAVPRKSGTYTMQSTTLASLERGQKAVIEAIDVADPQVQRLMTLGLVEGAVVELVGSALGGDPLEFRLFGCRISLRQEQARHFTVAAVATDG